MNLFQKIGLFFANLFNAIQRAFHRMSDEQKEAVKTGSGIVDLINNHLEETPARIRELLQEKYPNLPIPDLERLLFNLLDTLNITGTTELDDMDDVIDLLQQKLKSLDSAKWAIFSHTIATGLSLLLAPKDTKMSQIVLVIEWVYQTFFKKRD